MKELIVKVATEDEPNSLELNKRVNYGELARATYHPICVYCGFGIEEVLEVAHLDGNRENNDVGNLAILCPNCHKMLDIDLIPTETIILMRDRLGHLTTDRKKIINWKKRIKDAGEKAAATRKRRSAAKKASDTRKKNAESKSPKSVG